MKKHLPQILYLLLVLLVTTAFFGLIGDFIMAVFWAIILAILFQNRYRKVLSWMPKSPNAASGITITFVLLIVVIPAVFIGVAVVNQATEIVSNIQESEGTFEEQVESLQDNIPLSDKVLKKLGLSTKELETKIIDLVSNGTKVLAGRAVGITQNIFGLLINTFLMLYILFFFLRDGKRLVQELIWVIPIGDKKELALLQRFESMARATVKGSLLVALVQGCIGGILFWILGINAAFLWGVIMVIVSLLPTGSTIIWGPWAIVFFMQGDLTRAIILVAVGAGLIGVIDNFLRPMLVGRDTKMPDYLVLLSTFGGLSWFGLSGFVLGPIIAALFTTSWKMLGMEYGEPHHEVVTAPTAEEIIEGDSEAE